MSDIVQIKNWLNVRRPVIERDGYKCRICEKDAAEAKLHVHHINYDRKHNEVDNLVTLCSVCHRAVHFEQYKPNEFYDDWPIPWGNHPEI